MSILLGLDKAVLSLELKLVRASDSTTPLTLNKNAIVNNGEFYENYMKNLCFNFFL